MAISSEGAESLTSAARSEPSISVEHNYTDLVVLDLGESISYNDNIEKLVESVLNGCGRVDLVKIVARIIPTESGQKVLVGFTEVGSSATTRQAATKENGLYFVSNAMTSGTEITRVLIPEDTLSRQIRPPSAMLPTLKIMINKSKDCVLTLNIYLKVSGIRTRFLTLK